MTDPNIERYKAFLAYDFEHDERFQARLQTDRAGVQSLRRNDESRSAEGGRSGLDAESLERARWFYYTKFFPPFDLEAFRLWQKTQPAAAPASVVPMNGANMDQDVAPTADLDAIATTADAAADIDQPAYPLSFQAICDLITAGKPVPGIRTIPNRLNEEPPSRSTLQPRPKPWEKAAQAAPAGDDAPSTVGTSDAPKTLSLPAAEADL
ncbi:hypothetical protein THASP1DRAFT_22220 [Thamnocephalis sphaerospora]|uniref:Uncharacterized protein n=1 Tax=Thamnocephalis sphaerospora TaxID=78915 RepID=A0A4P9XVH4_9FUNG|nr:hypothetical protein THASP1DRAFT_22220 [Thamnocephalis sphaerospora]|eukprot:RKP10022.1 hypothetical protein THASP1DRAFT_22220 [Thamnocephalis sphaerospora]